MAKNAQAESAGQVQQLQQRIAFMEKQNEKYLGENQALRQAQLEMEERHTAEIIELKQGQLSSLKKSVSQEQLQEGEESETQMLRNVVKVKDEEIKQLRRQLGVTELELSGSPVRNNGSPLRPSKQTSSAGKIEAIRPIDLDGQPGLEQ